MLPTFFQSPFEFAITCAVVILAQMVYVLFGFGSGLVTVALLALFLPDLQDVVVLILLINLPAELFVVLRSRRAIDWSGVARLSVGIVIGIPLGTLLLRFGDAELLLLLLGVSLILIGAAFLRLDEGLRVTWSRWAEPPVGLTSGVLTGLFGTGGPPLVVYYRLSGVAKAAFRGNLMAIFLLKTFVRVPAYAASELITLPRLGASLSVLPAVLLGAWLGHRVHLEITESRFRRLVGIALLAIGAVILVRSL
jgi:uncharacterized membrane protein YfcA